MKYSSFKMSKFFENANSPNTIYSNPFKGFQELYSQGYSLIPLSQETKKPIVPWKEYQERQPTPNEVKGMVGDHKQCNWALLTGKQPVSTLDSATGVGLVVLDADDDQAVELVRKRCPSTVTVSTPSGGMHFLYRHGDVPLMNRRKTIIAGVGYNLDFKADGGYVVAIGGRKSNGKTYQPSMKLTADVLAKLPIYDPDWIICEGAIHTNTEKSSSVKEYFTHEEVVESVSIPVKERIKKAKEWMNRVPPCIQGKGKSGADGYCFRLANILVWGFALPADDAQEILLEWGESSDHLDNMGTPYPWKSPEIAHKISGAVLIEYDGVPGDKLVTDQKKSCDLYENPERFVKTVSPENEYLRTETLITEDSKGSCIRFLDIDDVLQLADQQQEDWLIENWIEFGSTAMLTGNPFSGKSCIVAELVASMHRHGTFGGYSVPSSPVILIDLENRHRIVGKRLQRATEEADCASLRGKFVRVEVPTDLKPLNVNAVQEIIEKGMGRFKPENFEKFKPLVIVDTFRSAFECDEMEVKSIKELLYPLQSMAQKKDAAILVLHHRPKNGSQYSGQSAIAGALDYLWMWDSNIEKKEATLALVGTRGDLQEPLHFKLDKNNRNIFSGQGNDSDGTTDEIKRLIIDVVSKQPGILKSKVAKASQDKWNVSGLNGKAPGLNKIDRVLDSIIEEATKVIAQSGANNAKQLYILGA